MPILLGLSRSTPNIDSNLRRVSPLPTLLLTRNPVTTQAYGPLVLVAKSAAPDYLHVTEDPTTATPGLRPLTFTLGDIPFESLLLGDDAGHHTCFRRT